MRRTACLVVRGVLACSVVRGAQAEAEEQPWHALDEWGWSHEGLNLAGRRRRWQGMQTSTRLRGLLGREPAFHVMAPPPSQLCAGGGAGSHQWHTCRPSSACATHAPLLPHPTSRCGRRRRRFYFVRLHEVPISPANHRLPSLDRPYARVYPLATDSGSHASELDFDTAGNAHGHAAAARPLPGDSRRGSLDHPPAATSARSNATAGFTSAGDGDVVAELPALPKGHGHGHGHGARAGAMAGSELHALHPVAGACALFEGMRLAHVLGQGGFAIVYYATWHDAPTAVKVGRAGGPACGDVWSVGEVCGRPGVT